VRTVPFPLAHICTTATKNQQKFIALANDKLEIVFWHNWTGNGLEALQRAADAFNEWGLLLSAARLVVLPIMILYFMVQKAFVEGITFGGVKG